MHVSAAASALASLLVLEHVAADPPLRSASMLPLRLVCAHTTAVDGGAREASVAAAAIVICRRRAFGMALIRQRDAHLRSGRREHRFGRCASGADSCRDFVIAE